MSTSPSAGYPARDYPINNCRPSWTRTQLDTHDAEDVRLTDSIRRLGLIHPIRIIATDGEQFIIDGDRRWKAMRALGFLTVPVFVTCAPSALHAQKARVATCRPGGRFPADELGKLIARTWGPGNRHARAAAAETGHPLDWITALIELRAAPDYITQALDRERITPQQAAAILAAGNTKLRKQWVEAAAHCGASVATITRWTTDHRQITADQRNERRAAAAARKNGHPPPELSETLTVIDLGSTHNNKHGEQLQEPPYRLEPEPWTTGERC